MRQAGLRQANLRRRRQFLGA
ncbi:hypothetical protein [Achromobacter sp. LC458]